MPHPRSAPSILLAAALALVPSCGGDETEVPAPAQICAHATFLPVEAAMVTRSGRVLVPAGEQWQISQLEPDATLSPIATVAANGPTHWLTGWLEHDPVSGKMWLLEPGEGETPPRLQQLDASGASEWSLALSDYARPVVPLTVIHHEGALFLSLRMDGVFPDDPSLATPDALLVERRDLDGELIWTHSGYTEAVTGGPLASALLVGVSGSALAMVATPPLVDYGASYPLTVDVETGEALWVGEQGGDPLQMAVDDARLYLAWVRGELHDWETGPEPVVISPATSWLGVFAPTSGAEQASDAVEWPGLEWGLATGGGRSVVFGWMGAQLLTLIEGEHSHGLAIHDTDGALVCKGELDVEIEWVRHGVGLAGRDQFVAFGARLAGEDDDGPGLLVIEPP